ncbi:MAG: hypothetical protein K2X01_05175 [Cyanobacteria bacterium]|nr:hypothetical protein [Cyanobacteriota bacterium]
MTISLTQFNASQPKTLKFGAFYQADAREDAGISYQKDANAPLTPGASLMVIRELTGGTDQTTPEGFPQQGYVGDKYSLQPSGRLALVERGKTGTIVFNHGGGEQGAYFNQGLNGGWSVKDGFATHSTTGQKLQLLG